METMGWRPSVLLVASVALSAVLLSPGSSSAQFASIFTTGEERRSQPVCPDFQRGAQAETPDDTFGCWASLADSNSFQGRWRWLDIRVKPAFALVYVNGRYAGTAQQFTAPFRPLRMGPGPQLIELRAPGYRTVSFWLKGNVAEVTTAAGTLTKIP